MKTHVVIDPETCDDVFEGTYDECLDYIVENDYNAEDISLK